MRVLGARPHHGGVGIDRSDPHPSTRSAPVGAVALRSCASRRVGKTGVGHRSDEADDRIALVHRGSQRSSAPRPPPPDREHRHATLETKRESGCRHSPESSSGTSSPYATELAPAGRNHRGLFEAGPVSEFIRELARYDSRVETSPTSARSGRARTYAPLSRIRFLSSSGAAFDGPEIARIDAQSAWRCGFATMNR